MLRREGVLLLFKSMKSVDTLTSLADEDKQSEQRILEGKKGMSAGYCRNFVFGFVSRTEKTGEV